MWLLTVESCVSDKNPCEGKPDVAVFAPVFCKLRKIFLKDVTLLDAAKYIAIAAKLHTDTQKLIVSRQTVMHHDVHICSKCYNLDLGCICTHEDQDGEEESVDGAQNEEAISIANPEFQTGTGDPMLNDYLYPLFREIFSFRFAYWLLMRSYADLRYVCWVHIPWILHWAFGVGTVTNTFWFAFAMAYTYILYFKNCLLFGMNALILQERARDNWRRYANRTATQNLRTIVRNALPVMGQLMLVKIMLDIIRSLSLFVRARKGVLEDQSALNPDSEEYIRRRNAGNLWVGLPKVKLTNVHEAVKTTTWQNLFETCKKNSVFVKSGTRIVGGFFIKTHLLLLPSHFFKEDGVLEITPRIIGSGNSHVFKVRVSTDASVRIPGTDLVLLYCPGGCAKKDLSVYFPTVQLSGQQVCSFGYRQANGVILEDKARLTFGPVKTVCDTYFGAHYDFISTTTFRGMCMGYFVSETKKPYIAGFHLGGITGTKSGCSGFVLRSELEAAILELERVPGFSTLAEEGNIPTVLFEAHLGEEGFMIDRPVAPRCPTNFLPEGAVIDVLGSCKGAVTNHTKVFVSHISESVTEILGVTREHGPPPMGPPVVPSWHNWSLAMAGFSTPAIGPFPSEVATAVQDYLCGLSDIPFEDLTPLDMPTIINGLDGDKFLNRMPQNTSVGFPLSGKLSKFCEELGPIPGHAVNFAIDDEILITYDHVKNLYAHGQRVYSVFRASLKDEAVKIGKLKVRVFQAAPVVQKMILREFFLPLAAQLSMYPLISECAVGINAFGNEWGEMMEHVETHGTQRIVAGDYSAYDQRMPSVLTTAAFDILVELARRAKYTERDIRIMQSAMADVIYPLLAFNGTLVQLHGGNPSGHNLTVYINSIVNSLISRMAFLSVYPKKIFRENVALMTYGDDDIGSVSIDCPGFNNISKSEYINSIGMKYTPPSKEGEHTRYLALEEVDFLKRGDVYNADLGRRIGVLDEASVFKSLHVRLASTEIDDHEWAGSVVDGALREFCPRGREYYEEKRNQLGRVAHRHGFSVHSIHLFDTYDAIVEKIS